MNTLETIQARKSVRRFNNEAVSGELIEKILLAGMEAPYAKISQPWKYYVLQGKAKDKLVEVMNKGLYSFGDEQSIRKLPFYNSVVNSIRVMQTAPVVILVFNMGMCTINSDKSLESRFMACGAMQTIGATIQNMLLASTELGLGSLWMCDVYFAYNQLCDWLGETAQLAAGIALGYPDGDCTKPKRDDLAMHTVYMED